MVQVTTPAGTSDGTASAYNTFTLVSQVQSTVTPVVSPVIGVLKESAASPPVSQPYSLYSTLLGLAKGSVITGVAPAAGVIGETVTLTMSGNELQSVTAVQFSPNTGLTVETPIVAADGKSLSVTVAVAANAPLGVRALKVLAGTTALPFSTPEAAVFKIILPTATLSSVEPIVLAIPSSAMTLALNGSNLQNATEIRITPNSGVTIANPPAVNADGTRATVTMTVAATAAAGNRVVSIVTPAGESSLSATVANTITLTASPGPGYGPVASPVVGLVKEAAATPPVSTIITPVAAPIVGVVLGDATTPPPSI